ncbi:MAG: hypothetical protein N2513_09925 [Deltaproteobacteria bacterium]|nr:hypothetical protein [Deltaproteobacteria bacterium]
MKKLLTVALAILISVAFVSAVFAQPEKGKAPEKPAAEKAAAPEKPAAEKPAKPKVRQFTGEVVKADASTLVVKSKKEEKTFDVSGVKGFKPEEFKEGDKVVVKYTEKEGKLVASSVKKAGAPKKEEKPAAEKPAEKPAPPKK